MHHLRMRVAVGLQQAYLPLIHRHQPSPPTATINRHSLAAYKPTVRGMASANMPAWLQRKDDHGAYIDAELHVEGAATGPLAGKTVAIKDMYDVAGHRTGFGHPLWRETHPPAIQTAAAVQALLDAGATVQGRTHMDELAYSLNGENVHYGTPANPAAPGRLPGGSSSGSAVAVAAGHVDLGLGSDTGGSVRVPASYCGVFGFRPTHGVVSLEGARPLAPSFDTVGWFSRNMSLMKAVASVLLTPDKSEAGLPISLTQLVWPIDAWELASPETAVALNKALGFLEAGPNSPAGQLAGLLGAGSSPAAEVALAVGHKQLEEQGLNDLAAWMDVFRFCQGGEIWQQHAAWIKEYNPSFGPGIKERFAWVATITDKEVADAKAKRQTITSHLLTLLDQQNILIMPTVPGPSPVIGMANPDLDSWRRKLMSLSCIAGLAGLPQVSLPIAQVDGLPVGLSLVGPRNSDLALLEAAEQLIRKTRPDLL